MENDPIDRNREFAKRAIENISREIEASRNEWRGQFIKPREG